MTYLFEKRLTKEQKNIQYLTTFYNITPHFAFFLPSILSKSTALHNS